MSLLGSRWQRCPEPGACPATQDILSDQQVLLVETDYLYCTQQQHSTSRGSLGNALCSCTPTSFSPHTPTPACTATHLQDIYKPDSARLRRHLSAVINFAKFREEKLVAYTEMQGRIDELTAQAAAAQAAHNAQVG
jgi:hypothetical protein